MKSKVFVSMGQCRISLDCRNRGRNDCSGISTIGHAIACVLEADHFIYRFLFEKSFGFFSETPVHLRVFVVSETPFHLGIFSAQMKRSRKE